MKHIPRKRFGQHFLKDQNILYNIVHAIAPEKNDIMVEIGPGLAALTGLLLKLVTKLHVIEIDHNLAIWLRKQFDPRHLQIYKTDVLKFDFLSILLERQCKLRIVGNLPYNISSPLLFYLMRLTQHIQDQHFMLQKEVVERLVAKPGTKKFGRLSVMLQWRYDMELLFTVQPIAFNPPPHVDSAMIRMIPIAKPLVCEYIFLKQVVNQAFSQRRKIICNCMHGLLTIANLISVGINPQLRPESLTIEQYVKLANLLKLIKLNKK